MATPLVTSQDIADRLGRPLSEAETARVDALIADASAEVRAYTGQLITAGTSTVTLPVTSGRVNLPQRPVVDVLAINGEPVDDPDLAGPVLRGVYGCEVTVTYQHGYDEVPGDIVSVVAAMVLRGLATQPGAPLYSRETIGEYSYGLPETALARRVIVDRTDRSTLDRYRTPDIGSLWVALP